MAKTVMFTQPELAASMTGGFASLTPVIVTLNHESGTTRIILWVTFVVMLFVFVALAIFLGKRRTKLEITDESLKHGKRLWAAKQIRCIEWNSKYRRVMIRPYKGFGLGMTLSKETGKQDADYLFSWAVAHKIPVMPK